MFKRKGGGGQRPFEQCSKKLHFSQRMASLSSYAVMRLLRSRALACLCNSRTRLRCQEEEDSISQYFSVFLSIFQYFQYFSVFSVYLSIFQYFSVLFSIFQYFSVFSRIFQYFSVFSVFLSIFQSFPVLLVFLVLFNPFHHTSGLASLGKIRTRLRCQQEEGGENASPLWRSHPSSCFFLIFFFHF